MMLLIKPMTVSGPLHTRVLVALINLLGRFVGIALPSQLKDFNLSMTLMLRLVVVTASALSITDFDMAASTVLVAIYLLASELLQWRFPESDFPGHKGDTQEEKQQQPSESR